MVRAITVLFGVSPRKVGTSSLAEKLKVSELIRPYNEDFWHLSNKFDRSTTCKEFVLAFTYFTPDCQLGGGLNFWKYKL